MAYKKDVDYQALIDAAAGKGDFAAAAKYETLRNEKIIGEGLNVPTTNKYGGQGGTGDTDYSVILRGQMANGAPAEEVSSVLGRRIEKASSTPGLEKYAYDDVYQAAMDYIKNSEQKAADTFTYESAPIYADKYTDQINSLTKALLSRDPFSYNFEEDPNYATIKKQYLREADRTQADTLASYAAMTGGMPSTAAVAAASQAADYTKTQLTDRIPELMQAARAMYDADYAQQLQGIQLLQGLSDSDYNRYLGALGQYNTDRSFAYGQFSDDYNRRAYEDETAYNRSLNTAETLAAYGDFSGYKAMGYTDAQIAEMKRTYEQAALAPASGRTGGGGGSEKSVNDVPNLGTDAWYSYIQDASAAAGQDPFDYMRQNYKKLGISSSFIDEYYEKYLEWEKKQGKESSPSLSSAAAIVWTRVHDMLYGNGKTPTKDVGIREDALKVLISAAKMGSISDAEMDIIMDELGL